MFKCYSDVFGNFPCDDGCLCDRCSLEEVEKINRIRPESFPESFVDDFDFGYREDDDDAENDWRRGIVNGIRVDESGLAIC